MDKLICIGKNYLDHAKELGDAVPEMPVIFLKPPSILKRVNREGDMIQVKLPEGRGSIHHECEIVVRLDAAGAIDAVTLGLDMTLREVQAGLKKNGHPWEVSKVFDGSAILGAWIPISEFTGYLDEPFEFSVNGVVRQSACGSEMRLSPQACIEYAKTFFPIIVGDAIFTGTPAGVGPVVAGDEGVLRWRGKELFRVNWK